jgi:hypothetical protein
MALEVIKFDEAIALIQENEAPIWKLFFIQFEGDREGDQLAQYWKDKDSADTAKSINQLTKTVNQYPKKQIFRLEYRSDIKSNNIFKCVFAQEPKQVVENENNKSSAAMDMSGLGAMQQNFFLGMLQTNNHHHSVVQAEWSKINEAKTELAVEKAELKLAKEHFAKREEELKNLEIKYNSEVEMSKDGVIKAGKEFLKIWTKEGDKGLGGTATATTQVSDEEKYMESTANKFVAKYQSMADLKVLGGLVELLVSSPKHFDYYKQIFESGKVEELIK